MVLMESPKFKRLSVRHFIQILIQNNVTSINKAVQIPFWLASVYLVVARLGSVEDELETMGESVYQELSYAS